MKRWLLMLLAAALVFAFVGTAVAENGVWDFETDPFEEGFTTVDADGDGNNWVWDYGFQPSHVQHKHYEGLGCAMSHSYNSSMGGVLTPDNWLITPEFECAGFITFWYNPLSKAYCDDPVGVYVTTDGGATWSDELLRVIGNAEIGNTPHEYTADLSAYEGRTVKVGFRHYDVEDQYAAVLDYIVYAPQANQYTITWKVDGQPDVTTTVAEGETPVYPNGTPAKEGNAQYSYEFAGWTPEVVPATEDATYTATWNETVNKYTVTWNIDGVTETEEYEYGATPAHADPAKAPGDHVIYTFAGWTPEIVPVTGDAAYTAAWTETPFGSVTYLVNGIQVAKLECVTKMTEDMVPAGIAWYGFVFKSWDKTVEDINAEIAQGRDVTVNGVMEVAVTNIHLTTIYGDDITEKDYTESRWITVTASAQNEAGQYFQYWTIDGVIISYSPKATIRIVASCTLEAHYGDTQLEAVGVAQLLRADYDNLNKREIFVAYMSAPDGATITSAGLYAAPGTEYDPAAGELTAANAKFIKNVNITDASKPCSYTWYKSAVEEGDVWYIRVFVTYELDGETTTILGATTAITAGTDYVAGN